jgi:hypothetical protein
MLKGCPAFGAAAAASVLWKQQEGYRDVVSLKVFMTLRLLDIV